MRLSFFIIIFTLTANVCTAQKKMDYTTFDIWNTISERSISNNGDWIAYVVKPGKGDPTLNLYNTRETKTYTFERADGVKLDYDNGFAVFKIHPPLDTVEMLKRKKTKKKDLPKDTLAIFNFLTKDLEKISDFKSFKMAERSGGYVAVQMEKREEEKKKDKSTKEIEKDSSSVAVADSTKVKTRKEGGDNGTLLKVFKMSDNTSQEFQYITDFQIAKYSSNIVMHSSGIDTLEQDQLSLFDTENEQLYNVCNLKGKYKNLSIDEAGEQVAFLINVDTTGAEIKPYDLYFYKKGQREAGIIAKSEASFMPNDWILSENGKLRFSKDGNKMLFGIAPKPLIQDSTILDDEIVQVEVWSHTDQVLYTQQEVRQDREKKRNYDCMYNTINGKIMQLESEDMPNLQYDRDLKHNLTIGVNDKNYQKYLSWEGHDYNDVYIMNHRSGTKEKIFTKLYGDVRLSPNGKYGYWYSRADSVWNTINLTTKKKSQITNAENLICYDELNDRPMDAWNYGHAAWIDNDESILIYDRYDIWKVNPNGSGKAERLTQGREDLIEYRYVNLNRDLLSLPADTSIMIHLHDQKDKSEGYAMLNLATKELKLIEKGPYAYTSRPLKAKNSNDLVYAKQSFKVYPDNIHTQIDNFKNGIKFTSVNPQQSEYAWGDSSLMKWEDPHGNEVTGMLILPDGFDERKKYPLIVNFYERSSQGLNRHRAPYPHRSTINYSYYVNKGYVIFNPDILYRVGEPGESCYDAVMSGVEALLEKGFIDESKMGVQGHSWGGYQIAHLLTRTNIFKCAESGAPVVNMVSAYGGIRWGSGMSRMFQYEHTQSRLGATLWEDPEVYLANSPIFNVDKIETPVLILHNDKDGAVPWYQGIEFFVAMRRLDKKAWLLNYNDEPHWPLKRQNRVDFNRRMEQFFDHYLMDAPMPEWMEKGVPATEKGINKGY